MIKSQRYFRFVITSAIAVAIISTFYLRAEHKDVATKNSLNISKTLDNDQHNQLKPLANMSHTVSAKVKNEPIDNTADIAKTERGSDSIAPTPAQQDRLTMQPTQEDAMAAVHAVENQVYKTANNLFQEEPVDYQWASSYEALLRDIFNSEKGLERVSVNTIECRSTMCQIVVFTPQSKDADFFTAMFYQALETYKEGKYKTTAAITRSMTNGITALYVTRKGHALEFYQRLKY